MAVRLSKREQKLVGMTVLVLLLVGGYFGVYETLRKAWGELDQNILTLSQRLEAAKRSFQQESKIQEEYDEVVASLRIEGNDSDKQVTIMKDLNALMIQAGVVPKTAKPTTIIEEENFQIFNFSYDDVETNMVDLTKFFDLLEKRSKVSEIQQIEIKPPSPQLYEPGEQRFKTSYKISRLVYR